MENEGTRLAGTLEDIAKEPLRVRPMPNPKQDELMRAAKRLRWLEFVCIGLTYEEKRTTGSLARRVRELTKRIATKNTHINQLQMKIKYERKISKDKLARERRISADISWDDKNKIIKQYLRNQAGNY